MCYKAVSYQVTHCCSAGWNQCCSGEHGGGQLEVAFLRHREGLRLAGGPGCHPLHDGAGPHCHGRELENCAMPFNSTEDGKIYQHAFGGQSLSLCDVIPAVLWSILSWIS
ncbi:hypothetical protein CR201_G0055959 [Pongo abelii]|uniref:Uncharacterized protein n=1 Tax=Pongo abelii TaxID=9601 RepID=A0A2J8QZ18_PONAB|nr:hypothetical protein CR201_G0055959 [Pongo abelii]